MRGSDPDAAVYWLARMLAAGEDPRFIARRMVVHAAEDVGNADPHALLVAAAAAQAVEFVGLPEAKIPMAQAAIYIATAPKSNAACVAIHEAMADARRVQARDIPAHLKNPPNELAARTLGHGQGYKYPHDLPRRLRAAAVPAGQPRRQALLPAAGRGIRAAHQRTDRGAEGVDRGKRGRTGRTQEFGG